MSNTFDNMADGATSVSNDSAPEVQLDKDSVAGASSVTSDNAVSEPVSSPANATTAKTAEEELSLKEQLRVLFKASKAFWLVNLVSFGDGIAYFGILTLLTVFLGQDIGLGDVKAGLMVSTFTGLVTLFIFGGGYISDWLGVRKAIIVSTLFLVLGRGLLCLCPNLSELGAMASWMAIVLMAVGAGLLEPTLYAGVKEFTDPRTASIGFGILYAIMNGGIVLANFFSPYLRSPEVFLTVGSWQIEGLGLGIQGVFGVCAALTLLMLLILLIFFTKKVEERDRYVAPQNTETSESQAEASEQVNGWQARLRKMFHPFADRRFLFFIFILLPVRTLFAHQWLTLPTYVFRCFPEAVGAKFEWISGINPLIIVVFVPLIAAFTRKVKVIDMMLFGTTVSALTTFLLVPGPDIHRLLLYVVVFSLGEAMWSSRFMEYVAGIAPAGQVGAYLGLAELPWFMAKFTTGLYSGSMLEHFVPQGGVANSEQMWLIYACIALITPLGLLLARKWLLQSDKM